MKRRPARPTLFPTRRSSDLQRNREWAPPPRRSERDRPRPGRSEEHTSELQSHSDLVCRLLLEKKKPPEIPLVADVAAGVGRIGRRVDLDIGRGEGQYGVDVASV